MPPCAILDRYFLRYFLLQNAVLTSIHTIWLREHNRVCSRVIRHFATRNLPPDDQFELVRNVCYPLWRFL